jgi:hypothetical protein
MPIQSIVGSILITKKMKTSDMGIAPLPKEDASDEGWQTSSRTSKLQNSGEHPIRHKEVHTRATSYNPRPLTSTSSSSHSYRPGNAGNPGEEHILITRGSLETLGAPPPKRARTVRVDRSTPACRGSCPKVGWAIEEYCEACHG